MPSTGDLHSYLQPRAGSPTSVHHKAVHMMPPYGIKTSQRAWPTVMKIVRLPAWRGRAAATRRVRARLVRGHLSDPASPSSPSAGGAARLTGRLGPLLVAAPCGAAGR